MKTLLFLDANDTQRESVVYAKECGYRVITCDNIPSHAVHALADRSYNVSTYDIDALKKVVEKEHVDGVVYLASAHGLYGATHLIEQYHLPGIPYVVEKMFSNKSNFRHFLKENGFPCPQFQAIKSYDEVDVASLNYPLIVKPVDSSGGNVGITKVLKPTDLPAAVELAF